jgi:hypothetical protein
MGKYFNREDVFPIIANSIDKIYQLKGDFASHKEIVQSLLDDPIGKSYVEKAQQGQNPGSAEYWAGVMVAHFSQALTDGRSEYANHFERIKIGTDWAYKPKSQL